MKAIASMLQTTETIHPKEKAIKQKIDQACAKIAPLWSLQNFVAVNPFMGYSAQSFEEASAELKLTYGASTTLPLDYYFDKKEKAIIKDEDLNLDDLHKIKQNFVFNNWINGGNDQGQQDTQIPLFTKATSQLTGQNWNKIILSQIARWASGHFDVTKKYIDTTEVYASWRAEASIDKSTEILGIKYFRKSLAIFSESPEQASKQALELLDIPEEWEAYYLQSLLYSTYGWSGYLSQIDFNNRLQSINDHSALAQLLAIHLVAEACCYLCAAPEIRNQWNAIKESFSLTETLEENKKINAPKVMLQNAADNAHKRALIEAFETNNEPEAPAKTAAQVVFCIDVRSETYRRNLEKISSEVETFGFAGFFGFPVNFVPLGHKQDEAHSPALISPSHFITEELKDEEATQAQEKQTTSKNFFKKFKKSMRSGAVSCFGYVSPAGIYYLPKLIQNTLRISSKKAATHTHEALPDLSKIALEDQAEMAAKALTNLGLTDGFAPLVIFAGHGATTKNNPHDSGLQCGACGGHSGTVSAKVAAKVLNDPAVRELLKARDIIIPEETTFVAAMHNTTSDEFTIYHANSEAVKAQLAALNPVFEQAGQLTRMERAQKLPNINADNIDACIYQRTEDWSEIRPEWGLAGCNSFIIAPRYRTKAIDLKGEAFLHSYDWKKDHDNAVLESIMTAPMIVTSWINLQYYASTVDNDKFGAGDKTIHNITSGLGVIEGNSEQLRTGLAWQSIHDGEEYVHDPLRLKVVIEAPISSINAILDKHPNIKNLFDNEWLYLMRLNSKGQISHVYHHHFDWQAV